MTTVTNLRPPEPKLPEIAGYVEAATGDRIVGWAWAPGRPDLHARIEVRLGSAVIATAVADLPRSDLASNGIGDGRHAYEVAIPVEFRARSAELHVFAQVGNGAAVAIGAPPAAEELSAQVTRLLRGMDSLVNSQRVIHRNLQAVLTDRPAAPQGDEAPGSTLARLSELQATTSEQVNAIERFVVRLDDQLAKLSDDDRSGAGAAESGALGIWSGRCGPGHRRRRPRAFPGRLNKQETGLAQPEQHAASATEAKDAGRATMARLRRQAIRGGLGMGGISLVCNVAALGVPLYNMEVFNRVMTTHNMRTLVGLTAGLGISVLFYLVIDHLRQAAMSVLGDRFARDVSPALLRASAIAGMRASSPSQALRDAETLRQFIGSPMLTAPFDLLWSPVLLVVLCLMGWAYAVVGAVCIVVLAGLNVLGDAVARRPMMEANEASTNGFRDVAGATRGAEAVVAMGMLPALAQRWEQAQHETLSAGTKALLRSRMVTSITRALRSGMTGAMVATGLILVLNGYASSGSLVAGNMILARILLPFEQFAGTLRQWADALAAWRRTRTLLLETTPARYMHALPRPEGRLTVERLVYLPPGVDKAILRGVSFEVAPGESIGLIGPSASGKSTLLKVLIGAIEPTGGGAFLDGHSTYLWNREDFARHVGYVPQNAVLTDGTVAENIARGSDPAMDSVLAAARMAGVHGAIAALPHGYATRIAGNGFTLSAGQRQRIALARALYSHPRVLVLDEPNAFLDKDGEAMLAGLLKRLQADQVTVLVSTHRPSAVRSVDKLLVLRDGMVEHFGERDAVLRTLQGPPIRLVRATGKAATA